MISLRDVRVRHGETLLASVDALDLPRGEAVTVIGESGSGKSLLAQAIMGNLPHGLTCTGTITVDGAPSDLATDRRGLWGRTIVDLPQEPALALDPTMRVLGQVAEGHPLFRRRSTRTQARSAASGRLGELGLRDIDRAWPHTLSGGMAQRVAFACTTVTGAPMLIADEPSKGLDAVAIDALATLLEAHLGEGGALLTITHDLDLARRLGGHVLVMRESTVVESGPAEQVLSAPSTDYTRRLLAAEPRHWHTSWVAGTPGAPLLEGRGLSKAYDGRPVLTGLDIDIAVGERIALTGPSGSGKSTLGNMLAGLVRPDHGSVTRAPALRQDGVQKLYQDPVVSFPRRVTLRAGLDDVMRRYGVGSGELASLLEELGLEPALLDRRPGQVSGGELQRLAIIRALMTDPQVLLADEPTSRLDPISQEETVRCLVDSLVRRGAALVLVTHDQHLGAAVCDRTVALGEGEVAVPALA